MSKPHERIRALETLITELKAGMPKHSVPAWRLIQLEELEEELAKLQASHPPCDNSKITASVNSKGESRE